MSPSPIHNRVHFEGDSAIVQKLLEFIKPVEDNLDQVWPGSCAVIDFQRILPCPPLEEFQSRTASDRSGVIGWIYRLNDRFQEWWYPAWERQLDWHKQHWRTMIWLDHWEDSDSTENSITFRSIDAPINVITALSLQFPSVSMKHEWYHRDHCGGNFTLVNGQVTAETYWTNNEEELKILRDQFGYDSSKTTGESERDTAVV